MLDTLRSRNPGTKKSGKAKLALEKNGYNETCHSKSFGKFLTEIKLFFANFRSGPMFSKPYINIFISICYQKYLMLHFDNSNGLF